MRECVTGIDLGGTNVRLALISRDGDILYKVRYPTQVGDGLESIIRKLSEQIAESCNQGHEVRAVGIGTAGAVLFEEGIVTSSPNFPDWSDVEFKTQLEKELEKERPLRIVVDNDANAIALGEAWRGVAKGVDSMICFTLGTGVGGGIALGGKIWRGSLGMAGEVGHITIEPDGPECNCGSRGCLEAYASATGLSNWVRFVLTGGDESMLREVAERVNGVIPAREIYECALKGDRLARDAWKRLGWALGIGVADVISVLNVEMVVIGGGVGRAWELFSDAMLREVRSRVYSMAGSCTQVRPANLGDDAGVLGAAKMAWESM